MRLFRTILALMMALSLAALPVGSASAATLPTAGAARHVQHHEHHAGADAQHATAVESCHGVTTNTVPVTPSLPKHPAKCPLGFCCVGASVGFSPVATVPVKFIAQRAGTVFPPADLFVPDHAGSPPFRPPRV
ncbi:MAG: hypothetical protein QM576_21715 [Rhodopseudomonas sp.]|uniref:hypothetical protein n=1 Tax=Rhodopseudomonas sp. TaxID=1078 RepID=UPI0039E6F951